MDSKIEAKGTSGAGHNTSKNKKIKKIMHNIHLDAYGYIEVHLYHRRSCSSQFLHRRRYSLLLSPYFIMEGLSSLLNFNSPKAVH